MSARIPLADGAYAEIVHGAVKLTAEGSRDPVYLTSDALIALWRYVARKGSVQRLETHPRLRDEPRV